MVEQFVAGHVGVAFALNVQAQDGVDAAVVVKILEDQFGGLGIAGPALRVEAVIARHEVGATVAVQVVDEQAIPPAPAGFFEKMSRLIGPFPPVLPKHRDRHPLTHQHQFGTAVAVQVGPGAVAHQPDAFERGGEAGGLVRKTAVPVVDEQVTPGCFGVAARHHPPAHEQVGVLVAVEIARHHAAGADAEVGQIFPGKISLAVVEVQPVLQPGIVGQQVAVAAAADVKIGVAIAIGVEKDGVGVLTGFIGFKRRNYFSEKTAIGLLKEQGSGLPAAATGVHVVAPVAVHVGFSQARAVERKRADEERLAFEIVDGVGRVRVGDGRWRFRKKRRIRFRCAVRPGRVGFMERQRLVTFRGFHHLLLARKPHHPERIDDRVRAQPEV